MKGFKSFVFKFYVYLHMVFVEIKVFVDFAECCSQNVSDLDSLSFMKVPIPVFLFLEFCHWSLLFHCSF